MSTTPYVGQISMFGGNFAPRNWALCNGQLMAISQNQALFAILGTTYGGDGVTTFGLPNMQGRVPLHWGTGQGLTPRVLGEMSGSESVTLIGNQMPIHNHLVNAGNEDADVKNPNGAYLAAPTAAIYTAAAPNVQMNPQMVGNAGGNQPHNNMQPYLAVTFIIALFGIFPSRN
jgi:microcystin-dependent protein